MPVQGWPIHILVGLLALGVYLGGTKNEPISSLVGDQPATLEVFKPDARHAAL